jgi:peptidase A4-like protein
MMRTTLMTCAAVAALAAGLVFPAAAQAATSGAATVPAPHKSLYVAGYAQAGCGGGPLYVEITGNIVVPAATDLNGPPGESSDILKMGALGIGVTAGVFVGSDAGQAYYHAFWQAEGTTGGTAPFPVSPGDVLEVTIDYEGSSGWLVQINDATTLQTYSQVFTGPAVPDSLCEAAAYEQSPYPHYDVTTQTSPIAFYDLRVRWSDGSGYRTSKLLGTPPAGARLYRYTLINTSETTVAVTSKPTGHNNNFTITDK